MIYLEILPQSAYSLFVDNLGNLRRSNTVAEVISGLRRIGYHGALLEENYKFPDWFSGGQEWSVNAAAFGQTPISYDSACIGVIQSNGLRHQALINKCRALGAPIILEVDKAEVREWSVSRKENGHGLVETYHADRVSDMLASRAGEWRPQNLLRLKNVGSYQWNQQLGLFVGLLPELEEHIQENLDPLLRETLSQVQQSYVASTGREPNPTQIFKLIFWTLTAKVFYDRQVSGFSKLSGDSDELLDAVARHYRVDMPRLLTRDAREIAARRIWQEFDFRNLSVEVLAQIWSNTLVDEETKRELSIHRTSRTIVRYIVERIMPFCSSGDDRRIILEPCSGSAVFLVGAMNILRPHLFAMDATERHRYFVNHLAGIEADPFGVEISRFALTLADFPNSNGWDIAPGDIFDEAVSADYLKRASVVLCNPPYGDFDRGKRAHYDPPFVQRPAAVLAQVLKHLHPEGVLGFVLPRIFVDGRGAYAEMRERIARRFASVEITLLPDRAFEADSEIAILIATEPIPHKTCRVIYRKVNDGAEPWSEFEQSHQVSNEYAAEFSFEAARESLLVPDLPEVWDFLVSYPTLDSVADIHRGIEWNIPLTADGIETGNRSRLVKAQPTEGFKIGVAPRTDFKMFEHPALYYLDFREEMQRTNAWRQPWDKPKAIVGKAARSRQGWRMAAFPDSRGISCYQTYFGIWPKSTSFDEWSLSAVLNSPVANAYVATREGKTDITKETLALVPVPIFTNAQKTKLRELIQQYQRLTSTMPLEAVSGDAEAMLKQIDAMVLSGYRMPPRIERQLLDFFRDQDRPTKHGFSEYFPRDFSLYFSLSDYLSPDFSSATVGELLKRMGEISQA